MQEDMLMKTKEKKGELLYRKVIELIHQKLFCGGKKKREKY